MLSKREFGNYFDTYSDAIYNFVYYKLNLDRELAFDMTQDIFFKALRSLEKFDKKKQALKLGSIP